MPDYDSMRLGQLRQRIADGDNEAEAFVEERFAPIREQFDSILKPFASRAAAQRPLPAFDFMAEHREQMAELERFAEETAQRRAEEHEAAVAREQAMVEGISALRVIAEQSAERELDADARERRADEREHKLFVLTIVSSVASVVAAAAAIITVL